MLDSDRRELARGAETIVIGPQVFDLLLHLVQNREHVVTKDNLIDVVWAGRIVSESTLTSHINAVRKAVGDTGDEQRLVRTIARKGYRFVGDVRETAATGSAGAAKPDGTGLPVPDRPSIAVLPFLNLSGDPDQDYFVDGVVDDIISALSRLRWLFVIARNSSFTYKGRAIDVKQVGRELGVRYVLEGSVRKAANRVRITGQIIDANAGATLWSERFESALDDVFELQDQMATSVVGALVPHLERAEIERARHKPTESLDAYDYYMRGMWKFRQVSRNATDEALPLFYEAIQRDPEFASAYAMAAWCHSWRKLSRWTTDRWAGGRRRHAPCPPGGAIGPERRRRSGGERACAGASGPRFRQQHCIARPSAGAGPESRGRMVSGRVAENLARRAGRRDRANRPWNAPEPARPGHGADGGGNRNGVFAVGPHGGCLVMGGEGIEAYVGSGAAHQHSRRHLYSCRTWQ